MNLNTLTSLFCPILNVRSAPPGFSTDGFHHRS